MKKEREHVIKTVEPGSIAEELELAPGDVLVSVNGQPAATFAALTSNGNGTTATVTLAAELRAGHNTVRLSAPSDWAPDIDYMDVVKAD